jgi:hypothetical protein
MVGYVAVQEKVGAEASLGMGGGVSRENVCGL